MRSVYSCPGSDNPSEEKAVEHSDEEEEETCEHAGGEDDVEERDV